MYSSLKALDAAATAPTNRSTAFQPKVKPRARKGTEDTKGSEKETQPAQPAQQTDTIPVNAHTAPLGKPIVSPVDLPSPLPPLPPRQEHVPKKPAKKAEPYGPVPPTRPPRKRAVRRLANEPVDENGEPANNRRVPSRSTPRKRRVNPDEEIDASTMSMKKIIELGDAREKKKRKKDAANKQDQQPESSGSLKPKETEHWNTLAPRVDVVDGKLVINPKSMEINARAQADFSSYRRIDESAPKLNYASHMKAVSRDRWTPEETEKFYKAIQEFGCDFAAIEKLFPGKSRKRIKLKYKKEMQRNALRLTNSLFEDSRGETSQLHDELLSKLTAEAAEKGQDDGFDFTWDDYTAPSNEPEKGEGSGMQAEDNDGHSNENSGVVDPDFDDEEMEDPACSNTLEERSPQMEEEEEHQNDEQLRTEENRTTTSCPIFAYQMEENVEQARTEENQTSSFPIFAYQMDDTW